MTPGTAGASTPPPERCSESVRTQDTLERVARTLGLPVTAFFPDEGRPDTPINQAADLLVAFVAIENPAARRTCLAFVRAMASS
jgi:hypothetical protein